jgi:hypothetical protein
MGGRPDFAHVLVVNPVDRHSRCFRLMERNHATLLQWKSDAVPTGPASLFHYVSQCCPVVTQNRFVIYAYITPLGNASGAIKRALEK